jgi:RNA polymerase-binding protein DksA
MRSKVLEPIREQLETERLRLRETLALYHAESGDNLGLGNHMADDATEAYEQAKELALMQNAERLLQQVEEALQRFHNDTYGLCEVCGQQIDPARLRALPYVTLCLHCQQRREH